jgi:hypothetical protein
MVVTWLRCKLETLRSERDLAVIELAGGRRHKKYNPGGSRGHGELKLFLLGVSTMMEAFNWGAVMRRDGILPFQPSLSKALFGVQILDETKI